MAEIVVVNTAKKICVWMICCFVVMAALNAHAATVNYTLDNVILADNTQMTGTFSWTFDISDFENGVGQFTSLDIPWTSHDQNDLDANFDVGQSIEITLAGSVHDDGVDITLYLSQSLTPTTSSSIVLGEPDGSKYEIGGNGFHSGYFLSGSISPTLAGDYNGNDTIDAAVYTAWRDAMTAGATSLTNDPTPGTVDESDFAYWRAHFGETLGSGAGEAALAAVPEPSTLVTLLMASLAILSRWSRPFHELVRS